MDNLGDRIKEYEDVERKYLTRRLPLIIRVDGKAFHSYTTGFERPFYMPFRQAMIETAHCVAEEISGCKIAYTQSDEITFVVTDDDNLQTEAWFNKNLQKIVSVASSLTTYYFNKTVDILCEPQTEDLDALRKARDHKVAVFDARAFCVPREEVLNVLEWRQQDCIRNAIEAAGRSEFSHGQLYKKSCRDILNMLEAKGVNFKEKYPAWYQNGACVVKKPVPYESPEGEELIRMKFVVDLAVPIFHEMPNYIEDLIYHRA